MYVGRERARIDSRPLFLPAHPWLQGTFDQFPSLLARPFFEVGDVGHFSWGITWVTFLRALPSFRPGKAKL